MIKPTSFAPSGFLDERPAPAYRWSAAWRPALWGLATMAAMAAAFGIDLPAASWFRGHPLPGDLEKMCLLAEVFAHGLGVLLILITAKTLDSRGWRVLPRLAGTAYLAGLAASALKVVVVRVRPYQMKELPDSLNETFLGLWAPSHLTWDEAFRESFQSFPSAHTATAFGLALGLAYLYPKGRGLFLVFAGLAGAQRMVAEVHFPSDVVCGAAIGLLVAHLLQHPNSLFQRYCLRIETRSMDKDSLPVVDSDDKLKLEQGETRQILPTTDLRRVPDDDVTFGYHAHHSADRRQCDRSPTEVL